MPPAASRFVALGGLILALAVSIKRPMPTENKIPVIYVAGPYRAATRELIAENIAAARTIAIQTVR